MNTRLPDYGCNIARHFWSCYHAVIAITGCTSNCEPNKPFAPSLLLWGISSQQFSSRQDLWHSHNRIYPCVAPSPPLPPLAKTHQLVISLRLFHLSHYHLHPSPIYSHSVIKQQMSYQAKKFPYQTFKESIPWVSAMSCHSRRYARTLGGNLVSPNPCNITGK